MKVYRITPFASNAFGHGGEKRTHQITNLLSELNIEYSNLPSLPKKYSKVNRLLKFPANYHLIRKMKIPFKSINQLWKTSNLFFLANETTNKLTPGSLVIYEHSSLLNWAIPIILKKRGHKVIAFPHNIETLVFGLYSNLGKMPNPNGFFEEIAVLRSTDKVFTISKKKE
jgi:hypothetical protein